MISRWQNPSLHCETKVITQTIALNAVEVDTKYKPVLNDEKQWNPRFDILSQNHHIQQCIQFWSLCKKGIPIKECDLSYNRFKGGENYFSDPFPFPTNKLFEMCYFQRETNKNENFQVHFELKIDQRNIFPIFDGKQTTLEQVLPTFLCIFLIQSVVQSWTFWL